MTPRGYRPGQSDASMDALRAKVLSAARALLAEPSASPIVSLDTVAAKAGVARSTIYQQFRSPAGLLEALFDEILVQGQLVELPRAFQRGDPLDTLDEFVALIGRFWDSERLVIRRLRSLATFDLELERALETRDAYRREGLGLLAKRLGRKASPARGAGEPLDLLFTLTSFETFDSLAGPSRTISEGVPAVQALLRAALGLGGK